MITNICSTIAIVDWAILIGVILAVVLLLVLIFRKGGASGQNIDLDEVQKISDRQFNQIKLIYDNLDKRVNQLPIIIDSNNDSLLKQINDLRRENNENIRSFQNEQAQSIQRVEQRLTMLLNSTEQRLQKLDVGVRESLNRINLDNNEKLDKMRETVDEKLNASLEKRLNDSFAIISDRLEKVHKGLGEMQSLATGVADLKHTLSNIKVRGVWGEVQLGNILEQMLSSSQYASQVQIKAGTREAVDFVVKLPGKNDNEIVLLPIDAKFPLEDYQRLVQVSEYGDKDELEKAQKNLEKRIKEEAKKIHEKYISPPATTDFAVMYLALEGLYAEVVKNAGLLEMLQNEYHIIVCGPTTLSALINSLQMGFKSVAIEKRSSEVWALLSTFKTEFVKFVDLLSKTQKKLDEASTTIEDATKKSKKIQKKLDTVTVIDGTQLLEIEQPSMFDSDSESDENE